MNKVALSMIVSGSEALDTIKQCLNSVKSYVTGMYVTITTPMEDKTLKPKLEKLGAIVDYQPDKFFYEISQEDTKWLSKFMGYESEAKAGDKIFQFDKARNHAMALIPKDIPWFIWLDADDVWRGGENLQQLIDFANYNRADSVFLNYIYQAEIKDGKLQNILIQHLRERLMKNNGLFEWVAPIHETLIEKVPTVKIDSNLCDVLHLSDDSRRQQALLRNIKTLELSIKQSQGRDPRPIYYLAKAYFDMFLQLSKLEYIDRAKKLFELYLHGSKDYDYQNRSGWGEERAQCWEYLVEIYRQKNELNNAIKAAHNALIEDERFPSIYVNVALCYLLKKEYGRALFWIKLAGKIPEPKTTLISNPKDLKGRTLEVIYHCCINLSKLDEAWAAAQQLYEIYPDSKDIADRVRFTRDLKVQRNLTQMTADLAKFLQESKEDYKIPLLLSAVPSFIETNPIISGMKNEFIPPRIWDDNEICIYCGPGFTTWNPKALDNTNPNQFVGGSEEAVIYMAKELTKLGWKVTVYADPGEEGEYEGVKYLDYFKFNNRDSFNIVVAWRRPSFVDQNVKAKKIYIWCHDIQNQLDYTQERLNKITKVMVLSPWHRQNIPSVPDDKILITGNGVQL